MFGATLPYHLLMPGSSSAEPTELLGPIMTVYWMSRTKEQARLEASLAD